MISALLLFGAQAVGVKVELRNSPVADTYSFLRSAVQQKTTLLPGPLATSAERLEELQRRFPDQIRLRDGTILTTAKEGREQIQNLYWRSLDAYVFGCDSLDDFARIPLRAPETIGGFMRTSEVMAAISALLREAVPSYSREMHAEAAIVRERQAQWDLGLKAKMPALIDRAAKALGLERVPASFEILIVPSLGGREGLTIRSGAGIRLVIGAEKHAGSSFAELVLHESVHVLDSVNPDSGFFFELREAIDEAERPSEDFYQLPHAATYVISSQLIREALNPKHVDIGETDGVYKRGLTKYVEESRQPVIDLLAGKIRPQAAAGAIGKKKA